jgi:predicted phosphodiesterase
MKRFRLLWNIHNDLIANISMIYTYDDSENVQRPVQTFNGKGMDYVIHAGDYYLSWRH